MATSYEEIYESLLADENLAEDYGIPNRFERTFVGNNVDDLTDSVGFARMRAAAAQVGEHPGQAFGGINPNHITAQGIQQHFEAGGGIQAAGQAQERENVTPGRPRQERPPEVLELLRSLRVYFVRTVEIAPFVEPDINASRASGGPARQTSPFLRLPRKIRDMVYMQLFARNKPIYDIRPFRGLHQSRNQRPVAGMRLMAVNRQIWSEATAVFYTQNEFVFEHLQQLHEADPPYIRSCMAQMRRVRINIETDLNTDGARLHPAARDSLEYLARVLTAAAASRPDGTSSVEHLTIELNDALRSRWGPAGVVERCFKPQLKEHLAILTRGCPHITHVEIKIVNRDAALLAEWAPFLDMADALYMSPAAGLIMAESLEEYLERLRDMAEAGAEVARRAFYL